MPVGNDAPARGRCGDGQREREDESERARGSAELQRQGLLAGAGLGPADYRA